MTHGKQDSNIIPPSCFTTFFHPYKLRFDYHKRVTHHGGMPSACDMFRVDPFHDDCPLDTPAHPMNSNAKPLIRYAQAPALTPQPDVPWAQTMVLNPAIEWDAQSQRLHMLFRATGPGSEHQHADRPEPFPIYLGYAYSTDRGQTWEVDYTRPALAPQLADKPEDLYITNASGQRVVNYANGCLEDPRLNWLDGKLYLSAACRLFPPGPYWDHDDPLQCAPTWAKSADEPFGRAARENLTVTVLYEVHPDRLVVGDYDHAFSYLGPLADPQRGDNRDAFLFPERLRIDGQLKYACIHRPREGHNYDDGPAGRPPSIYLAVADRLEDLASSNAQHIRLAEGVLAWEGNRVGGSAPPIRIDDTRWLLPYHGKQNDTIGYTQSFMILEQDDDGWPRLRHRCGDRMLYVTESWQAPNLFPIPCLFTCGAVHTDDGELIMSYGAADEVAGMAWTRFDSLVQHVMQFNPDGTRA